ncbi:aldehyde ferredoxin oxidoreductase family protein [Desulfobotulus mexicanus]|uniref:Aldehyde ferredoxin oxidoreductase n=1 Tax=Desulfobotulus mexicanus TaxID=2586642 RepID=A0A5S5MDR9_9BACT|nr:aldehyde ferredoxin oxidoreductase C-terminal domain-containing protein [Desulfobotulus mexicanus]TYT73830.1 aldehyde ferredoxin oxidoreductase [Desulfobotulus mexicanus]
MKKIRILDINLGNLKFKETELSFEESLMALGGMGLNARILTRELSPETDPLGPDNILIFSPGLLAGSGFPTASRTEASALSPATSGFGTSNSGLFFGGDLKRTGYDSLIFRSRAESPVYLSLMDGKVLLLPASEIWGKDAWESIDWLDARYPESSIALIGPAGEKGVRFASIQNRRHDAWGRTGLGAVMGSKNLKAIVIQSREKIRAAETENFREIRRKATRIIKASRYYEPFKKSGTLGASPVYGKFDALPTKNFSGEGIASWPSDYGHKLHQKHVTGRMACESCWIACGHMVSIAGGNYAGQKLKALEISPTITFCAQAGLSVEDSFRATEICQRYGMDMLSAGATAAMAFQLFEEGKIHTSDTGFPLIWGDGDAFCRLLEDMALKRGLGSLLAEGTARAAEKLGHPEAAVHIRGLEMPMIDPRGRWSSYSFGMLTNIRGGDHLRCRNPFENLRENLKSEDLFWEAFRLPEEEYLKADIFPESLKKKIFDLEKSRVFLPLMALWSEDLITLFNTFGICIRPPILNTIGPTLLSETCRSFTGTKISPEELMESAATSWNLIRSFNLACGEKPGAANFPKRFFLPAHGKKELSEEKLKEVLKAYYTARGWDDEGRPEVK